jgi:GAF domain-containing protein
MNNQKNPSEVLTAMWALGSHMREQFDRMRQNSIAELTAILGEPVYLDEHGAIILNAEQRARLLEVAPAVHESPPGFQFESTWGVPIVAAEEQFHV